MFRQMTARKGIRITQAEPQTESLPHCNVSHELANRHDGDGCPHLFSGISRTARLNVNVMCAPDGIRTRSPRRSVRFDTKSAAVISLSPRSPLVVDFRLRMESFPLTASSPAQSAPS